MRLALIVASLGLAIVALSTPTRSAQAYATRHDTYQRHNAYPWRHSARGLRHRHSAFLRRAPRMRGGYSMTVRDVLLGPAKMPPVPTDFGPHFDFPPASLNDGPTEAPYPGW
jgi:hypothetical protein